MRFAGIVKGERKIFLQKSAALGNRERRRYGTFLRHSAATGGGEVRNPPLWQMKADAAPMRQRILQALASQNDYAES